jgi:hypothetical protein
MGFSLIIDFGPYCRNPTLAKCEDETHTPKVGDLESFGTPECLEFDNKGHLDICSPSYGQKKGRESNWQFDSRPLKSRESTHSRHALGECNTALESSQRRLQVWFRPRPDRRLGREAKMSQSPGSPKRGQFRDSTLGVPGQTTTWVWVRRSNAENTIGRLVVTRPKLGPWCVM